MPDQQEPQIQNPKVIEPAGGKKRIVKNAVMLYLRMFTTMIVGLYTSRVVLEVLGVEDFGVYGVVGGVTGLLGFLNASMSGATSRFLTYELGRGDKKRLAETFSSALISHIGIAIIVFVFAQTVGLWFLTHKLVIPAGRMYAAHWVYQMTIISAMLSITQVPYNASIIAHEKMDVYAYMEILNAFFKLLIVYLLTIGHFDKLILYALLVFVVKVFFIVVYRIYCVRHFEETRFHWVWDRTILKPMMTYTGWNLYGTMCVSVRQQGLTFLINIFFGVIFNAASGVATMVQGVVKGFTYSSTLAFKPQIIKSYAVGNYKEMMGLMKSAMSFSIFMTLLLSLPIFMEIRYLMDLWLVTTPVMAVEFVRLLLVSAFFALLNGVLAIGIEATGFNKQVNFYTGTIYMLTIPVMYVLFRLGFGVVYSYICIVVANVLIFFSNSLIIKYLIPSIRLLDYVWLLLKSVVVVAIVVIPVIFIQQRLEASFVRLVIDSVVIVACYLALAYWMILDEPSRAFVRRRVLAMVKRS